MGVGGWEVWYSEGGTEEEGVIDMDSRVGERRIFEKYTAYRCGILVEYTREVDNLVDEFDSLSRFAGLFHQLHTDSHLSYLRLLRSHPTATHCAYAYPQR